jgi:hypothetical protein
VGGNSPSTGSLGGLLSWDDDDTRRFPVCSELSSLSRGRESSLRGGFCLGRILLVRALSALVGGILLRRIHRSYQVRLLVPEVLFSFVSHESLWSDWGKAECATIRAEGKRRYQRGKLQSNACLLPLALGLLGGINFSFRKTHRADSVFATDSSLMASNQSVPLRRSLAGIKRNVQRLLWGWKKDPAWGNSAVAGSFGCLQRI